MKLCPDCKHVTTSHIPDEYPDGEPAPYMCIETLDCDCHRSFDEEDATD